MPIPAVVAAAASALLPVVADLFRARGSGTSSRNAEIVQAAAPVLVEIARKVVPDAANEQAAVETVLANKTAQQQFRAEVAMRWSDLEPYLRFDEESRREAREFATDLTGSGPEWRQIGAGVLIGVLSLTIILGGGAMFWSLMSSPQLDPGQKGLILGALLSVFSSTAAYWFGSSATSRLKDQTINEQAKR